MAKKYLLLVIKHVLLEILHIFMRIPKELYPCILKKT